MQTVQKETGIQLVNKLADQKVKFMLVWNWKDDEKTQTAVRKHKLSVAAGKQRNLILMAFQNQSLPEYTILALTTYPIDEEVRNFGFNPVRKDKANWIPIQYQNRKGKEHIKEQTYDHTTNYYFLDRQDVIEYLEMSAQLEMVYK